MLSYPSTQQAEAKAPPFCDTGVQSMGLLTRGVMVEPRAQDQGQASDWGNKMSNRQKPCPYPGQRRGGLFLVSLAQSFDLVTQSARHHSLQPHSSGPSALGCPAQGGREWIRPTFGVSPKIHWLPGEAFLFVVTSFFKSLCPTQLTALK